MLAHKRGTLKQTIHVALDTRTQAKSQKFRRNKKMAPRSCGIVRMILSIAFLIVFVQVVTIYHFASKYPTQIDDRSRRESTNNDDYLKFEDDDNINFMHLKESMKVSSVFIPAEGRTMCLLTKWTW